MTFLLCSPFQADDEPRRCRLCIRLPNNRFCGIKQSTKEKIYLVLIITRHDNVNVCLHFQIPGHGLLDISVLCVYVCVQQACTSGLMNSSLRSFCLFKIRQELIVFGLVKEHC